MSKIAFIFPGQGGQFAGQGKAWAERDPEIASLFKMADEVSGRPVSRLCFEGPLEELSQTANLQPAILTVSLSALRLMKREAQPDFAAGHSLGEFGALCAAGVFDEETALKLVTRRAALMQAAAEKNPGAMMAVLGLPEAEVEPICELARAEGLIVLANYNTPEQYVISGEIRAVAAAGKYVKLKGGKAIGLPVSGAFHSPMVDEAAQAFREDLLKAEFKPPICPVVPNALGTLTQDVEVIRQALLTQITSPVRWTKTVASLAEAGATEYLEAWPKSYMGSLIKKTLAKDSGAVIRFQE